MLRVVNFGMPRTGTQSLQRALKTLGYKCDHYVGRLKDIRDAYDSVAEVSIHEPVDHPWVQDAKVIVTVREVESWVESCRKMKKRAGRRWNPFWRLPEEGWRELAEARPVYVQAIHPDALVFDICGGDGWGPLCDHLKCDVPDCDFPHENKI